MTESMQERCEREGFGKATTGKYLMFTYNLSIAETADKVVSDAALRGLATAVTAMGKAWLEALPRREPK